jgi:elongation factor 2
MNQAGPAIFEPLQVHVIECPEQFMGTITKLVGSKRGQMLDISQEGTTSQIKAKIPVAEMMGWSNDLRSATEGRGTSSILEQDFERVPQAIQDGIIKKIRERKGLSENQ